MEAHNEDVVKEMLRKVSEKKLGMVFPGEE